MFGTYAGYKKSNPSQLVYVTIFDSIRTAPNLTCCANSAGQQRQFNIIRNLAYNNWSSEMAAICYSDVIHRKGASGFYLSSYSHYPGYSFINSTIKLCGSTNYIIEYHGIGWLGYYNSKKIYIDYNYRDTVSWDFVKDFFTGTRVN